VTRINPASMSASDRLEEIAEILAVGLMRLRPRQSTHLNADGGDSSLDWAALFRSAMTSRIASSS
jgi:hypothetical protein